MHSIMEKPKGHNSELCRELRPKCAQHHQAGYIAAKSTVNFNECATTIWMYRAHPRTLISGYNSTLIMWKVPLGQQRMQNRNPQNTQNKFTTAGAGILTFMVREHRHCHPIGMLMMIISMLTMLMSILMILICMLTMLISMLRILICMLMIQFSMSWL